jgi:uncharacterized Rossmann fold enzyme
MAEVHCLYSWNEKKARQFESWVKAHPDRYVLFLEENPAMAVLTTPHERIRCIAVSEQNRQETFEQIAWEFLYLPFSFESENQPLLQELSSVQSEIHFRAFDFADQGAALLKNFSRNLAAPTHLAKDLEGKFNFPAIVCGGGPSLAAVAADLKRLQDKALIIGCGAGVEALLKMGIQPHFAAHVDPASIHKFTAASIPLFYQLRTDSEVVAKYKGPHFLAPGTGNFPLESWIQQKWGLEPVFDGGWTVGTFGVALAASLGCPEIILAGIDLAAAGSQLYAPGVKTKATADNFVPMKNREGQEVMSRSDWVMAAHWLSRFAQSRPSVRWGTISRKGLEIPGIPLIQLPEMQGISGVGDQIRQAVQSAALYNGQEFWKTIQVSFQASLEYCRKILGEMEKIFPQNPNESGACALLEHDLSGELAYQQVLQPLWLFWQHPILRHNTAGEWGVYLNRILFFQSLCEKVHAL